MKTEIAMKYQNKRNTNCCNHPYIPRGMWGWLHPQHIYAIYTIRSYSIEIAIKYKKKRNKKCCNHPHITRGMWGWLHPQYIYYIYTIQSYLTKFKDSNEIAK